MDHICRVSHSLKNEPYNKGKGDLKPAYLEAGCRKAATANVLSTYLVKTYNLLATTLLMGLQIFHGGP